MSNLKDSLSAPNTTTVTLSGDDVSYLMHLNQYMQMKLTEIQEYQASQFLTYLAVNKFGMDPHKAYIFNYHPEKESDNLTIAEIPTP